MMTFDAMEQLNFERYSFKIKNRENKPYIFDIIRKKEVVLTPEEWVRQHCVHFLIQNKHYPIGWINVEKQIELYGTQKRYDIVVFSPTGGIEILVECKAPNVKITQATFDQIAQYNLNLKSNYLMVTNGIHHYYSQMNFEQGKFHFLKDLPKHASSL